MTDKRQRADAAPKTRTGEDKGPIRGPQRTGDVTQVKDTSRGSGPATRNASGNRG